MIMSISSIFRPANRSLIRELVSSDFKLRYQNSVLGYLWSLLRPLLLFGVLYIVFTKIVRIGGTIPHYPSYLLLGLVIWTFFVESTMSGLNAITGRGDLVKKVSIPKYVFVISTTTSSIVNLLLNLIVLAVFMIIGHVEPNIYALIVVPMLLIELVIFCLSVSFLLAALFVKFRDLGHIWEVMLQVLFYATPIIYPLSIAPIKVAKLMSFNPLTQIIQDARAVLITPDTLTTKEVFGSQSGRIIPMLVIMALAIVSTWYFKRSSGKFAEEL